MKIEANGIGVRYEIEGPETAPVVAMSHSLAANVGMWDDQMPVLGEYRVLRYDTRGHGGRTRRRAATPSTSSRTTSSPSSTPWTSTGSTSWGSRWAG